MTKAHQCVYVINLPHSLFSLHKLTAANCAARQIQSSMSVMSQMRPVRRAFREPLTHFLLIAIVIFAVDAFVESRRADPRQIVVDAPTYQELLDIFREGKGRLPSEAEMGSVLLKWSENEVLYREARRLGLDKGDDMIRSRLILKIRNILFSNVVTAAPTEQDLRAWLDGHRDRYDRPALIDLEQAALDPSIEEAEAQRVADSADAQTLDDSITRRIRRYQSRPTRGLVALFDENDVQRLLDAPVNSWHAVRSQAGWHIARITRSVPGIAAEYENIRGKLAEDWKKDAQQQELARALQAIVKDYEIRLDLDAEQVRDTLAGPATTGRSAAR